MSITLNGTTGIITPGVINSPAATTLTLQSAGLTALTIDTSQNVGVGTTLPTNNAGYKSVTISSTTGGWLEVTNGTVRGILQNGVGDVTLETRSAHPLIFGVNSTERARITSSGNVGIGVTDPSYRLDIAAGDTTAGLGYALRLRSNATAQAGALQFTNSAVSAQTGYIAVTDAGVMSFTGKAFIDASGNLLVGLATPVGGAARLAVNQGSGVYTMAVSGGGLTGVQAWYHWINGTSYYLLNNLNQGLYLAYGGTSWTANSDERLKTALIPFENAAAKVATLRAGTGRYLNDAEDVSRSFLIAQDVQKVLPEAIDVQADEQGTLGLRYTDLIPLLTAAIQEQQTLITALTERVAALETKV